MVTKLPFSNFLSILIKKITVGHTAYWGFFVDRRRTQTIHLQSDR